MYNTTFREALMAYESKGSNQKSIVVKVRSAF
jgi:hypothetical protein